MMPRMSGFQVCRRLKGDPKTRDIQILMVTALNELGDIEQANECGTDDFVSKPVNKLELLTRVKSLLRVRHLKSELERALTYLNEIEHDDEEDARNANPESKRVHGCERNDCCRCSSGVCCSSGARSRRRMPPPTPVERVEIAGDESPPAPSNRRSRAGGAGVREAATHDEPQRRRRNRRLRRRSSSASSTSGRDRLGAEERDGRHRQARAVARRRRARVRQHRRRLRRASGSAGASATCSSTSSPAGASKRRTEAENRDLLQRSATTPTPTRPPTTPPTSSTPPPSTWSRRSTSSPAGCSARRSRRTSTRASTRSCSASWRRARASRTGSFLLPVADEPLPREPGARAGDRVPGSHPGPQPRRRVRVLQARVPARTTWSSPSPATSTPEEMLAAVQKYVGDANPAGRVFAATSPPEPPVALAADDASRRSPSSGRRSCSSAFPSITLDHPDLYALDLLATILGGGESSILVEELRDKQQLVSADRRRQPHADVRRRHASRSRWSSTPEKIAEATDAVLEMLDKRHDGRRQRRPPRAAPRRRCAPRA